MGIDLRDTDGIGEKPITDSGIISTITDDASWDENGDYTGSVAGLIQGNVYYDDNMNLRYYFNGTTLRRSIYNSSI